MVGGCIVFTQRKDESKEPGELMNSSCLCLSATLREIGLGFHAKKEREQRIKGINEFKASSPFCFPGKIKN